MITLFQIYILFLAICLIVFAHSMRNINNILELISNIRQIVTLDDSNFWNHFSKSHKKYDEFIDKVKSVVGIYDNLQIQVSIVITILIVNCLSIFLIDESIIELLLFKIYFSTTFAYIIWFSIMGLKELTTKIYTESGILGKNFKEVFDKYYNINKG